MLCRLEKRGKVYLLTLTGETEHLLNPTFLSSITSALDLVRSDPEPSSALVTSAEGNFFSNGFDLQWLKLSPSARLPLLSSSIRLTIASFLTLPVPTVAAVTGHVAGGAFALVFAHDYVVMRSDRGLLYMSEVDRGLPVPRYFHALMREKIWNPRARRDVILGGKRVTAAMGVRMGIVDVAVEGAEATVEAAVRMAEELAGRGWDGSVYVEVRKSAFPEICRELGIGSEGGEDGKKRLMLDSKL